MSKSLPLAALALLAAAGVVAKSQAPEVRRYLNVKRM
jgi:Family of unknown function (DUF6893)